MIEEKKIRFLLTGSSARKLKRGHANLLAGRARWLNLWPLTWHELEKPKINDFLLWGGLPEVWLSEDRQEFLDTYIDVYLKEEIMAEQLARHLIHFSRFLKTAAICSGQLINFSQVASDSAIPTSTVKNYFEVLHDTMIGVLVEPWIESKKRKAIQTAKFYFFDLGVKNRLLGIDSLSENTDYFGQCFEHFIFSELRSYIAYRKNKMPINYWRSVNQHEVDFIIGNNLAIEVKAKKKTSQRDAKNLKTLAEEKLHQHFIVVSQDPLNRKKEGVEYLHWKSFIEKLWSGNYF